MIYSHDKKEKYYFLIVFGLGKKLEEKTKNSLIENVKENGITQGRAEGEKAKALGSKNA